MPSDIIAIPPRTRTLIYYGLGVANVAVLSTVAAVGLSPWLVGASAAVSGLSGLFFGVAASNVREPVTEA